MFSCPGYKAWRDRPELGVFGSHTGRASGRWSAMCHLPRAQGWIRSICAPEMCRMRLCGSCRLLGWQGRWRRGQMPRVPRELFRVRVDHTAGVVLDIPCVKSRRQLFWYSRLWPALVWPIRSLVSACQNLFWRTRLCWKAGFVWLSLEVTDLQKSLVCPGDLSLVFPGRP